MIFREKVIYDGVIPSSNSVAAMNLLRLARMTGNAGFEKQADLLLRAFPRHVEIRPSGYTHFLQALDFAIGPAREIVIAGDLSSSATKDMINTVHRVYFPNRVLMLKESGQGGESLSDTAPFTRPMIPGENGPAAYVCENFSCRSPVTDVSRLRSMLEATPSRP